FPQREKSSRQRRDDFRSGRNGAVNDGTISAAGEIVPSTTGQFPQREKRCRQRQDDFRSGGNYPANCSACMIYKIK
ncbi:MAG: hypothetical protein LBF19_05930, partial [Prevotellaceae bacterium]|nr:hypothetical protein [Prevotellaceae bacterium]